MVDNLMALPLDQLATKLWLALISRGSEIDEPKFDKQYLEIERAIVLLNEFTKTGYFYLELAEALKDLKI